MECRVFENFQKKYFEIPKMPKSVPKSIQTGFRVIFSKKILCPVFRGGSNLRKFSKKSKKNFKNPKTPKMVPKRIQTCFDCNLGQFFRKNFAKFSKEGRVFEIFQKNQKIFKIPKTPKIVPKSIQTCFEQVLGQTFRKFFAQCSMEGRVFENFQKKIKKFSKFQKCPKSFPNVSKRVLNLFWVKFFEIFFCPVFRGGSSFRKFSKKKYFQNSKNAQKCSQKYPNVF